MRRTRLTQPGFTLIEASMASALLLFVVVALTHSILAGQDQTYKALHSARGVALADALLEEVLSKPWDDPDGASAPGPESGEAARWGFDNLDDYHGYSEPAGGLVDAAGAAYGDLHQLFDRAVAVTDATQTHATLGTQSGVLVTITVTDRTGRAWSVQRFVASATAQGGGG